jgi:hypothetical protein
MLVAAACDTFGYRPENAWRVEKGVPTWASDGLQVDGRSHDWQTFAILLTIRNVSRPEAVTVSVLPRGERNPPDGEVGEFAVGDDVAHAGPRHVVARTSNIPLPARGRTLFLWLRANRSDHVAHDVDMDVAYDLLFKTADGDVVCPVRLNYGRTGP